MVLGVGVDVATLWPRYAPAHRPPCAAEAADLTVGQRHAVCLSVMIARLVSPLAVTLWSVHDIANTNFVWCAAYKRGVEGGSYIAQLSCNSMNKASIFFFTLPLKIFLDRVFSAAFWLRQLIFY